MDRDLVVAAQQGDQAAFVDLVRFRGGRFFAIAHRILRDVDRAEDALQEALVIAWRDLPSLRDPDRFDAWVHRLLTNVCIAEAVRERKRISNLYLLPLDGPAAPDELLGIADRDLLDRGFRRLLGDVQVGPTVGDLVDALGANPSYAASTPSSVTFGTFSGMELELQLPAGDVISTCDAETGDSTGSYYVFSGGSIYAQGSNNRWQVSIIDVGGTRLVTALSYFEGTPQADLEAARAIVESLEFTP